LARFFNICLRLTAKLNTCKPYKDNFTPYSDKSAVKGISRTPRGILFIPYKADSGLKSADSGVKAMDFGLKAADSGVKAIDFGLKATASDLKGVDSDLKATASDLKAADFDLESMDSDMEAVDSDLKSMDFGLKAADSDLKAADSDLKAVDFDLKAADFDLKAADSDLKSTDSDLKAADSDLKSMDSDLEAAAVLFRKGPQECGGGAYGAMNGEDNSLSGADGRRVARYAVRALEAYTNKRNPKPADSGRKHSGLGLR
jgi:hypothetical protein